MKLAGLLIAVVLCVLSVTGPVVAQTLDEGLNALWGTNITVGELWAKLDPSELVGMSDKMRNTKVTWGTPGQAVSYHTSTYVGPEKTSDGPAALVPLALFVGAFGIIGPSVVRRVRTHRSPADSALT